MSHLSHLYSKRMQQEMRQELSVIRTPLLLLVRHCRGGEAGSGTQIPDGREIRSSDSVQMLPARLCSF